jgi:RNA polymerase sigma-70 factor (ECF subfamily)
MESQIIKKAISGDPEALTILIENYKDIAYNLALSIVRNKENAKDITQDSFLKVLENIDRFRSDSKFSTWLYRIVYNQAIGFIKHVNHKEILEQESTNIIEFQESDDNKDEDFQGLYNAIEKLEDTEKNIILLFYLAEKSVKEISQITTLSISNIKVILHRSRKKLYEKIGYDKD